ncbi:MAG: ACP S-malonyltransferase [Acholeplasmataceae bacterium]|nr:ACP S-malonyltransferase [Acholeplasmataceae bacterium]
MSKLGVVFAGQGSQYLGMGLDFCSINQQTQQILDEASIILGYDVKQKLSFSSDELNQTVFTQPLVFLSTIFAFDELIKYTESIEGALGFSLGEYAAFYAANIFSFKDLLMMVQHRGFLMNHEASIHRGKMAAIVGLDSNIVNQICHGIKSEKVVCANFNSPFQTVISGEEDAVDDAIKLCIREGAKRTIILNVSGAFHSPLMKNAALKFYEYIKPIEVNLPTKAVYLNTTSELLNIKDIKEDMMKQIFSPVLFMQSIKQMINDGFTHFIEVGPGNVLSAQLKKIDGNLEVTNLSNINDIEHVKGWLLKHGFEK